MILLFDIGNTHTHVALANERRILRRAEVVTAAWFDCRGRRFLRELLCDHRLTGAGLCSVVPAATLRVKHAVRSECDTRIIELSPQNLRGLRVDYPRPRTVGADRLANAVAARQHYGVPVVVLDFGTALTLDVVDGRGCFVGGVIAPGLAAMTSYLHDRTALLPRVNIRNTPRAIGRSTAEAMRIGIVRGYCGLVRELLRGILAELKERHAHVVATGGYARLIAASVREIQAVDPLLTLEGVRLCWESARRGELTRGKGETVGTVVSNARCRSRCSERRLDEEAGL